MNQTKKCQICPRLAEKLIISHNFLLPLCLEHEKRLESKFGEIELTTKNSTIYTPQEVSQFINELLKDKIEERGIILDPCCGQGSLLKPWEDNYRLFSYDTYGVNIDEKGSESNLIADFFTLTKEGFELNYFSELEVKKPILILCNPPFNGYPGKLACEVWLDKIIELFGKEVPIVLFVPMGFRLNRTKFNSNHYPPISSIISLPRDIFPQVEFHTEILIFNIKGLQPHYFFKPYEQH